MKYFKWIYGTEMSYVNERKFKIDEVNEAEVWNPKEDWEHRGGFNFANEKTTLRWVSKGDTLYDVILPKDAELLKVNSYKTPDGMFIANKIIITNPRPISDKLTMELYKKSDMPLDTYFETIAALAMANCYETAKQIIKDKVTVDNIDRAIEVYKDFVKPWHKEHMNYEMYKKVLKELEEKQKKLNSSLFISEQIDKEPYIKKITNDKIINLTGESGSGKSTYAKKIINDTDYIVIDTDVVFGGFETAEKYDKEIGQMLRNKYKELPDPCREFNIIYKDILNYFKDTEKTVVIDSAQFRNLQTREDLKLLKGKVVVIRTSIDECYKRCIERWKKNHDNYTIEELKKYSERKKNMYKWYQSLNMFIDKVNKL